MKGTGDGGGMVGGSRKIKSFLWLVVAISFFTAITTKMGTPDQIAVQGLYMIGAGGLFTIGGQSLVDSIQHWAVSKQGTSVEKTTVVESTKTT